jgi:hypothetical protein
MPSSDKNSEMSSFSVPPLFKGSPSYGYMYAIEKGQLLTLEEKIWIDRIIIGCSKLIYSSYLQGAKNTAKAYSKLSKKDQVSTYSITHLTMSVKDRSKFRPSAIRKKLPDEDKHIQASDLSDILKSLSNINLITKAQKDAGKRGSPSKNSEEDPSEHGRQSFYQPTEYLDSLKQVIAKPMARKLIFAFLLESNLIHKWLDFNCLLALYISKFRNVYNIKNIDKAVGVIQDELKDEKLHKDLASITDKRLEGIAHKFAELALQHFEEYEDMYTNLYIMGGIYFNA